MDTLLAQLKEVLGIAAGDMTQDARLTSLLTLAMTEVEGMTKRYFGLPMVRLEYRDGTDDAELALHGHIDDSALADNPSETLDPTTSLVIARRARRPWGVGTTWVDLVEGTDWERRDQVIVYLSELAIWWANYEYRLTYQDGYAEIPADVRAVIIEIAFSQLALEHRQADGSGGIKSETLGDFAYSLDLSAIGAGGNTMLSDSAKRTLNRYKRGIV